MASGLCHDDGCPWLDIDGASRVDCNGVCDGRWQVLWLCWWCRLYLHRCDGLNSSHSLGWIVKALSKGTALFVHNVSLAQTTDALEDVLSFEEGQLHVASTSPMAGSDDLVGVDVHDVAFFGVSPAQTEGEAVRCVGMIADDDLMFSDVYRGKRDGFLGHTVF